MDANLVQEAIQNVNLAAIMPSLVLSGFGMVLLLVSVFSERGKTTHVAWLSFIALIVTAFVSISGCNPG